MPNKLIEKLGKNLVKMVNQADGWKVCSNEECFYASTLKDALQQLLDSITPDDGKEENKENSKKEATGKST